MADDYAGSTSTTGTVSAGGSTIGNVETAEDTDWFRITLAAGKTYQFDLNGSATSNGTLADPFLRLHDSAGTSITSDDDSGTGLDSLITYTPTASGTYYLSVGSAVTSGTGTYRLSAADVTVAPTYSLTPAATTQAEDSTITFTMTRSGSFPAETLYASTLFGTATSASGDYDGFVDKPITFTSGQQTATFTVALNTDSMVESTEQFRVMIAQSAGQSSAQALDISDVSITDTTPVDTTFDIVIDYTGNSLYQTLFDDAAQRWEQIITADLPDVISVSHASIDDLLIDVTVVAIDGIGGTLAQAAPDEFLRGAADASLPDHGFIEVDSADVQKLYNDGTLLSVILHEIGHVLGIGTLWDGLGLRNGVNYTGVNALAEYSVLTGNANETAIPVEDVGPGGSIYKHWRETTFNAELMTSVSEPVGVATPISRLTIASLKDLGYTVDLSAADAYSLPAPVAGSISINDVTISEGDSGTKLAALTVTRTGGTAAFAVNYATADGGATVADSDYVTNSNTLQFGANVNMQTISVTINGDTKVESDEAFYVNLSGSTNGATISDSQGIGTITNDDITAPVEPQSTLPVSIGGTATILHSFLYSYDDFSGPDQVTYTVVTAPIHGTLLLNRSATTTFTQADIDSGLVQYRENGDVATGDNFAFTLADAAGNETGLHPYTIAIVDTTAPVIDANATLPVAVGSSATIWKDSLCTVALGSEPTELRYSVLTGPVHGMLLLNGAPATSFTQAEIDDYRIQYRNSGDAASSDSFTFQATDAAGDQTPVTTFNIAIPGGVPGPGTVDLALLSQYAASGFATAPNQGGGMLDTYLAAQGGGGDPTLLAIPQH